MYNSSFGVTTRSVFRLRPQLCWTVLCGWLFSEVHDPPDAGIQTCQHSE